MRQLPTSISEVLNMEITENKHHHKNCDFIEDAIKQTETLAKEEIRIDFYHLVRNTVGRDYLRVVAKVNSFNDTAIIMTFGGQGMSPASVYRNETINKIEPVIEQALVTDPLCVRFYHTGESIETFLYNYFKEKFIEKGHAYYYDVITGQIKRCEISDERNLAKAIDQKILEFRSLYVLEDQPFPMLKDLSKDEKIKINVLQHLANYGVWIQEEFTRYSLKS